MTTIFAPAKPKSTRKPFGAGILASMPNYRLDCTLEDDAWWMDQARREEDAMFDRMAAEARAMDRMEAGLDAW